MKAFYQEQLGNLFVGDMTRSPFPLHVHETLELSYLYSGSCVMQIDGADYRLAPGDISIAFPLAPHSFEEISEDCRGLVVFFAADSVEEYADTFHRLSPVTPVVRAADVPPDARFALDRLSTMKGCDDDGPSLRPAYLHVLLGNLLADMKLRPAETLNEPGLADRVIKYVFDHACENISLASAARGLGISESHLSHLFSGQLQVNFRRFVNAIRIDKAQALMRDPSMTLTAVCYTCGYENLRTFRRAFVRETGLLPTAYLQKMRGENPDNTPIEA